MFWTIFYFLASIFNHVPQKKSRILVSQARMSLLLAMTLLYLECVKSIESVDIIIVKCYYRGSLLILGLDDQASQPVSLPAS